MLTNRSEIADQNRHTPNHAGSLWKRPKIDDLINDESDQALIRGPIRLPNNPIVNLFTTFRVAPGIAVLTVVDGTISNILVEGSYHVLNFPFWKRVSLYVVNMRRRTLDIRTEQVFTLSAPSSDNQVLSRPIDLSLIVTYQAIETMIHHLALSIDQPVTMLYDAVLEAVREVTEATSYPDFKAAGRAGALIAQQLQGKNIQRQTGVRVINVQVPVLRDSELPRQEQSATQQHSRPVAADGAASAALLRLKSEVAELVSRNIPAVLKEDQEYYYVHVTLRDRDWHYLTLYFICTDAYPQEPPKMTIELDGVGQPDASELLQQWNPDQELVELVEMAMNRYS